MRRVPATRLAAWLAMPGPGGLVVVGALVLAMLLGPGASAETADEARLAAREAAADVAALQRQVEEAQLDYQAAIDGLAGAVSRSVTAEQQALVAVAAAQEAEAERARTVRALYANGGSLGLVESLLSAQSLGELVARRAVSDRVLVVAADRVTVAEVQSDEAVAASQASYRSSNRTIATVQDVEAAFRRLSLLLDHQQEILDRLDARARSLAEAEAAAAQLAAQRAAADAAAMAGAGRVTAAGIPAAFERLYRSAATTCRGLGWPVLAAIGQVESGHGQNMGPSSAGAMGPMQFLPSTFAAYAVDGDKDGDKDIWDPADSIYSAAKYLCANGAGMGPVALYKAIWAYNHVDWYVVMVANVAGQIAKRAGEPVPIAQAP